MSGSGVMIEKSGLKALLKEALMEVQKPNNEVVFRDYVQAVYMPYHEKKNNKDFKKDLGMINILCFYIGDCKMAEISEYTIQGVLASLKYDRKIKGTTINRYRARLSNIFNHAIKNPEHIISFNPTKNIDKYQEFFRDRALTHYEAGVFLASCMESKNTELYDIARVAFHTGMRFSEIFHLNTGNISLYENYIELAEEQTKSGYSRKIPLHKDIRELIFDRYKKAIDGRLFKGKSIRTALQYAIKRAKLHNFRFHDMRRTCATWLWRQGNNLHTIQKILGHSTITMTEKYLAADIEDLAGAINSLPSIPIINT